MSIDAVRQLDAIHTMLSTGHRNLRMERHSLMLWGIAGGLLFALSEHILTPEQFPEVQQRAIAWLLLLTVVLSVVGIADWHLTRKIKAERDEVWSFIHRQIMKVWWLIFALGALLTFAMFFYGGGFMAASAWIVLLGLGLFIHGLFSEILLEWAGGSIFLIGIATLCFQFEYSTIQWIAASVFGIGLPLLALMLNRREELAKNARHLLVWLLAVITPPLMIQRYLTEDFSNIPQVSLSTLQNQRYITSRQILTLPQNTLIPVKINVSGDLFQKDATLILPLRLAKPVEILMVNGKPTRKVRYGDGGEPIINAGGWINIPKINAELSQTGPVVNTELVVELAPR